MIFEALSGFLLEHTCSLVKVCVCILVTASRADARIISQAILFLAAFSICQCKIS